ncbi:MAG: hypothetical protein HY692_10160 [Cyanobacteria bacterium NC_groundwater_1444_Ag_S-0.65um_54_12]|nr:hypothetical protein [Cyanobacteria bacterium NC_groundwater_1444_Ag_S-0.65um_54_12]
MGSDLRYSLINTFAAIDALRQNILFNMQGVARPGFAKKNTHMGLSSSLSYVRQAEAGSDFAGAKPQIAAGPSELHVAETTFSFTQGEIGKRIGELTSLAIKGEGFFAVAENLQPGARIFLTRDGSFHWQDTTPPERRTSDFKQFQLVNKQGLYLLRTQDIDLHPSSPTFLKLKTTQPPAGLLVNSDQERDGTRLGSGTAWLPDRIKGVIGFTGDPFKMNEVQKRHPLNSNSDIAIMRVPLKEFLQESSFGATIYETNIATRAGIVGKSYFEWVRAKDSLEVQSESIENPDFTSIQVEANIQSEVANFVFKNLRDMLDNYNRSLDDLLGLVR